jgi:RND family efflux transporter MFP subunit
MMRPFLRLALLLLLALSAGCDKSEKRAEAARPAMTILVRPTPALDLVLSGSVEPKIQTPISFRVLGRMIARPVKVGDRVEAGQTIAAVDPLAFETAVRSAVASLASARAQFDNAAATEARQAALLAKATASQATYDAAEQARAAARAAVSQAEANLAKAREQLSYALLKADYAGVITATSAEIGQTVSPGQPIVALAEPTKRDAVVDAPEAVADSIYAGQQFVVSLEVDPKRLLTGAVREIAPEADAMTRTRRVKIELNDPPPGFGLGATIAAQMVADPDAFVRLPDSALLQEGEKTSVFVVDPKTFSVGLREIEVAPDRTGRWIVRGGLNAGERVVTAGVHRLKSGQIVRIIGSETP